MAVPLETTLINEPGATQVTENAEMAEIRESMYERAADGFVFVREQTFDPGRVRVSPTKILDQPHLMILGYRQSGRSIGRSIRNRERNF